MRASYSSLGVPEFGASSVCEPFVYLPGAEHRATKRDAWHCATELDARGKPPPKPADAIRATLANGAAGAELYVRTSMRPDELIEVLRREGISAASAQLPDGSWRTLIARPSAT